MIGHDVKATVILLFGDVVRIGIDAPSAVGVHRQEVYLELQQANLRAAASTSGESARSKQARPPPVDDSPVAHPGLG